MMLENWCIFQVSLLGEQREQLPILRGACDPLQEGGHAGASHLSQEERYRSHDDPRR